jgi:hypothetical protein
VTHLIKSKLHVGRRSIFSFISTLWVGLGAFCAITGVSSPAETNGLDFAALSFPDISADVYRADVATHSANMFIAAGKDAACGALYRAAKVSRSFATNNDSIDYEKLNLKLCHLTRLLFLSTNSSHPLRPPRLGTSQFLPVLSMNEDEWPDLPFCIRNGIALSMNLGYAGSGIPERAKYYLDYCRINGTFRTRLLSEPTFLAASNALKQVFDSHAWKSLKWSDKDFGFSYSLDEGRTKKMLWQQVQNLKIEPRTPIKPRELPAKW